jgi:hypothetical protein
MEVKWTQSAYSENYHSAYVGPYKLTVAKDRFTSSAKYKVLEDGTIRFEGSAGSIEEAKIAAVNLARESS